MYARSLHRQLATVAAVVVMVKAFGSLSQPNVRCLSRHLWQSLLPFKCSLESIFNFIRSLLVLDIYFIFRFHWCKNKKKKREVNAMATAADGNRSKVKIENTGAADVSSVPCANTIKQPASKISLPFFFASIDVCTRHSLPIRIENANTFVQIRKKKNPSICRTESVCERKRSREREGAVSARLCARFILFVWHKSVQTHDITSRSERGVSECVWEREAFLFSAERVSFLPFSCKYLLP